MPAEAGYFSVFAISASRAEVKELQEEVSALQRKVTEVSEQKQLMEASIENVKYERDRLKQQVRQF